VVKKNIVRIANEKIISTNKTFIPTGLFVGQKYFTCCNFTVLPQLKCIDFIFGLPAMKDLNMYIQPSHNLDVICDQPFSRESQPRWISCLLVNSSKMQQILEKAARNKRTEAELFLALLLFAEELESIITDFGFELDTQLKERITEIDDVTRKPHGLPLHRGVFVFKIRLTA
jgi:hypothetical protein